MNKAILYGMVAVLLVGIVQAFPSTADLEDYISFNSNDNLSDILKVQLINYGTVNTTGRFGSAKFWDADGQHMVYYNSSVGNYSEGTFCFMANADVVDSADADFVMSLEDPGAKTHTIRYFGPPATTRWRFKNTNHDGGAAIVGMWHVYCLRWSQTRTTLLRDGVEFIDSTDVDAMNFENMNLLLGSYKDGLNGFRGEIDEISIWSRNLTNAEIIDLNNSFYMPQLNVHILHPVSAEIYSDTTIDLNWSYENGPLDTCYYAVDDGLNQTGLCPGGVATNITIVLAEGIHNITIWVNNSGFISIDKITSFIIDTTFPTITAVDFPVQYMGAKDGELIKSNNLTGTWRISDTNLFHYDLSIDGQLIQTYTNIPINNYLINLSIDTDLLLTEQDVGLHYINITVWDGHTNDNIDRWFFRKDLADDTITFDFGDDWVSITPLDIKTEGTFNTFKEPDRYSFTYDRKDNTKSDERFLYRSSRPITEVSKKRSEYPGWLIIEDLELWVDTATASSYDDVKVKRLSEYAVEVTLKGVSDDVITLDSIGKLNKNNATYVFYIFNATEWHTPAVMEQQTAYATLNISIGAGGYDINASFDYNGTYYSVTKSTGPENILFSTTWLADLITSGFKNDTYFLHWYSNFTTAGNIFNTTVNHTVYNLKLDNCTITETGTLNITVLNYTSGAQVPATIEYTLSYWLPGSSLYALNYSNTEIQNETICIYPDFVIAEMDALISYIYGGVYFEYSINNLTLTNISQDIFLYVTDGTTQVLFTVVDLDDNPVVGAYIHVLAYDVGSGSYITTEILQTDSQGQALGNIVLGTTYYNFLIYYQGDLVLEEQGVKLITTTRTFVINLAGVDWWDAFGVTLGVPTNLIFNNATNNFVYTWTDGSGVTNEGCLKVDVSNSSGKFNLVDSCVVSASGTVVYNIGPYNGTTFTGTGYLKISNVNFITDVVSVVFEGSHSLFYIAPQLALFLAFLWCMTLFFVGLPHPFVALPLFGLGIMSTIWLGLWSVAWLHVGSLLFLIVLKLYLAKS